MMEFVFRCIGSAALFTVSIAIIMREFNPIFGVIGFLLWLVSLVILVG